MLVMERHTMWTVGLLFLGLRLGPSTAYVLSDIEVDSRQIHAVQKREVACGGKVTMDSGEASIQLPTTDINGTSFYGVNQDCTWTIEALPGQHLFIASEYFSLELSDNCEWDYVEIVEQTSSRGSRYCGWDALTYLAADHDVTVTFKSDVSYEDRGFNLLVSAVDVSTDDSKCNQTITAEVGEVGDIRNHEEAGSNCYYSIQAPYGYMIELNLKFVRFESDSAACEEESIVVHKGQSSHGEKAGTICSDAVANSGLYRAQSFFIAYNNPTANEGDRFQISYTVVVDNYTPAPVPVTTPSPVGGDADCSGFISNTDTFEFTYTTPAYENNRECVVVARTPLRGHVVQVEFLKFELEDSEGCEFDSMRVYSGEREDSMEMGGPFCGDSLKGRTFMSNGNSLKLAFKTDESFALYGAKVKISFVPTGCVCEDTGVCVRQQFEKQCLAGKTCSNMMCQNGGTCVQAGGDSKCYCPDGFYGDDCSGYDGSVGHLTFKHAPQDKSVERGKTVTVWCEVEAPHVEYEWYFEKNPLPDHTSVNKMGSLPGGLLKVDDFSEDVEGHFSCVARVGDVSAEHTFKLTMVEDCAHKFTKGPTTETANVGNNVLLYCYVIRDVKTVKWQKNGKDMELPGPRTKMIQQYLSISDVTEEDAGKYRCVATDSNGCTSFKEGELHVLNVKQHSDFCGMSSHDQAASGRITKASNAKTNDNPWHVTLRLDIDGMRKTPFCGGTLISRKFVVTATHCMTDFKAGNEGHEFNPDNVLLLFGSTSCTEAKVVRRYKQIHVHKDFNKNAAYDNDIALLELEEPIDYDISVRPICLSDETSITNEFFNRRNSVSKITGCGVTVDRRKANTSRVLKELPLPYVDRAECEETLEKTENRLTENMICAGFKTRGKGDACYGDSGGGMVSLNNQNKWVLTGIVSWASGRCDRKNAYTMYTNVAKYYDWIEDISKVSEEEAVLDM